MLIETDRLLLRPMQMDDLDGLVTLHSQPEVTRFMSSLDRQRGLERLEADRREWAEHGHGMLAILDRMTGEFLGRTGLKRWSQFGETEVGWALMPAAWGRGLAAEAARACIGWGFGSLDVPYVTAMIRPDNARSLRVAKRLGMTALRHDQLDGVEVIVHAVTREGWGAQASAD